VNPTSRLIQPLASVEDSRVVELADSFSRLYATYQNKDKILQNKLLENARGSNQNFLLQLQSNNK
jgi:hypothetical protein